MTHSDSGSTKKEHVLLAGEKPVGSYSSFTMGSYTMNWMLHWGIKNLERESIKVVREEKARRKWKES